MNLHVPNLHSDQLMDILISPISPVRSGPQSILKVDHFILLVNISVCVSKRYEL